MGRNYLAGTHGDAANAVLAAGYNFRRLLEWLALFCPQSWPHSTPRPPPLKHALTAFFTK